MNFDIVFNMVTCFKTPTMCFILAEICFDFLKTFFID